MYQEAQLVEFLKSGKQREMLRVYDHFSPSIYGVICKIVSDDHLAEDLLQDTFIKVWDKRSQYDPAKGRLFTWIMRIAKNLSLNYLNSKAFKDSTKILSIEKSVYNKKGKMQLNPETIDTNQILCQIEEKYRIIIEMVYLKGYTQKEISEKLEIPLGTVKSSVKIALRKLRRIHEKRPLISAVGIFIITLMYGYSMM